MPALGSGIFHSTGTLEVTIRNALNGFKVLNPPNGSGGVRGFPGMGETFDSQLHVRDLAPRYMHIANYWAPWEKRVLQEVALSTAAISVICALVTSFWFWRMRKRLRHNLIMFLITGDLMRCGWMLIISSLSLHKGQVESKSAICQASGWFVQFGTIMNDWAALALAVHGAIQIIRPSVNNLHSVDMMFVYRHYIYAALLIIPTLCASLGYIHETGHYTASGAFCMLPIRPLVYRLALSWIPRYIIGVTILGLTIAVYMHVRNVYRDTTRSKWWALSSIAVPRQFSDPLDSSQAYSTARRSTEERQSSVSHDTFAILDVSNFDTAPSRRPSTLTTGVGNMPRTPTPKWDELAPTNFNLEMPLPNHGVQRKSVVSISTTTSSTGIPTQERDRIPSIGVLPPPSAGQEHRIPTHAGLTRAPSTLSNHSNHTRTSKKPSITLAGALAMPIPANMLKRSRTALSTPSNTRRTQRAAIRRHLRLTFIYPLVYILMWLGPFVLHCMQYSDYFAMNPPFTLGIVATICYTLMAAIDCTIFGYREKPWRHIPGNTAGTFLGSFRLWGNGGDAEKKNGGEWDGSGRWGSWSQKARTGRTKRGKSLDSEMDIAPDADLGPSTADEESANFARAEPRRPSACGRVNTLATINSNENASHQSQEPVLKNAADISGRLKRTASSVPRQLSQQPGKVRRKFHLARSLAKRSDAEQLASEHAQARLKQELADRKVVEGEELGLGEGWARAAEGKGPAQEKAEKHWWDMVRKDSDLWGGSRRSTAAGLAMDIGSSPSESEPASPGQSPGEKREAVGFIPEEKDSQEVWERDEPSPSSTPDKLTQTHRSSGKQKERGVI